MILVNSSHAESSNDFDWSQPVSKVKEDKLELDWDDDDHDTEVTDNVQMKKGDMIVKPEKG